MEGKKWAELNMARDKNGHSLNVDGTNVRWVKDGRGFDHVDVIGLNLHTILHKRKKMISTKTKELKTLGLVEFHSYTLERILVDVRKRIQSPMTRVVK